MARGRVAAHGLPRRTLLPLEPSFCMADWRPIHDVRAVEAAAMQLMQAGTSCISARIRIGTLRTTYPASAQGLILNSLIAITPQEVELVAALRPSTSASRWYQQLGPQKPAHAMCTKIGQNAGSSDSSSDASDEADGERRRSALLPRPVHALPALDIRLTRAKARVRKQITGRFLLKLRRNRRRHRRFLLLRSSVLFSREETARTPRLAASAVEPAPTLTTPRCATTDAPHNALDATIGTESKLEGGDRPIGAQRDSQTRLSTSEKALVGRKTPERSGQGLRRSARRNCSRARQHRVGLLAYWGAPVKRTPPLKGAALRSRTLLRTRFPDCALFGVAGSSRKTVVICLRTGASATILSSSALDTTLGASRPSTLKDVLARAPEARPVIPAACCDSRLTPDVLSSRPGDAGRARTATGSCRAGGAVSDSEAARISESEHTRSPAGAFAVATATIPGVLSAEMCREMERARSARYEDLAPQGRRLTASSPQLHHRAQSTRSRRSTASTLFAAHPPKEADVAF
ncbi:hypothetical protein BD626DRAFT_581351 [Schizophyllum amplum]|uniref:Uncharacterized protein n=1 Tax=Schizophyllum amplum TaxID=97359 RepID=A0A550CV10_9AGAR|nr:hypothetical protein BD626DRAFT_581349 [Auriculariopsis ampla]TRM68632.1 hypothetical protein BD626DRAFT_581351 [Auriculariopsis ampla]